MQGVGLNLRHNGAGIEADKGIVHEVATKNKMNERASLARATRVVIHSYLYLGLRPLVRGKLPLTMEIQ